ncbi:MAG: DNA-binding protein, partial [Sandaracinaceae bacterium]|nr:DNA-binding protein [Sandaracinaceae bacterium]
MIRFESRKLRRVIARLEPGEELVQSVAELARHERVRAGWLRAMGHLAWAELALHDPRRAERGRAQRFDGPFDLVSLDANVSVEGNEVVVRAQGALARRTDNGVEVLGG